jgi:hypothetical protein
MSYNVKGISPTLLKVAFELRYRHGYTFLDRCGRTINEIQEYYPDWVVGQAGPQSGGLLNVQSGAKFNFSNAKLDLGIDQSPRGDAINEGKLTVFSKEAEELTAIVIDQLGLSEFSRIGCRAWYLFAAESMEGAYEFLRSLEIYPVSKKLIDALSGEELGASHAAIISGKDRMFRVGLDAAERAIEVDLGDAVANIPIHSLPSKDRRDALVRQERLRAQGKRNPLYAAVIDVDAYREEPPPKLEAREFIESSLATVEELLQRLGKPE